MAKRYEFTDRQITEAYGDHVEDQRAAAGNAWLGDREFIDSFLNCLPEGGSVLDVGAGTGNQAAYFAARGFTVCMTEGTSAMLAAAQRICAAEGRVGVLPDIPYEDNQFDGVFSRHVLHHLSFENVVASIENFFRILRPGGHIALIMSVSNDSKAYSNWYHIGGDDYIERNFYPVANLQKVFQEVGLNSVNEEVLTTGAMPLYRTILQK